MIQSAMGGEITKEQLIKYQYGDVLPLNFLVHDAGSIITSCIPYSNSLINSIAERYNIGNIINLTETPLDKLCFNCYEFVNRDVSVDILLHIKVHHIAIPDGLAPTAEQVARVNKIYQEARKDGKGIWIHCWLGKGRCRKMAKAILGDTADFQLSTYDMQLTQLYRALSEASSLVTGVVKPWDIMKQRYIEWFKTSNNINDVVPET